MDAMKVINKMFYEFFEVQKIADGKMDVIFKIGDSVSYSFI